MCMCVCVSACACTGQGEEGRKKRGTVASWSDKTTRLAEGMRTLRNLQRRQTFERRRVYEI